MYKWGTLAILLCYGVLNERMFMIVRAYQDILIFVTSKLNNIFHCLRFLEILGKLNFPPHHYLFSFSHQEPGEI